jgi:ankyrin repeat protein
VNYHTVPPNLQVRYLRFRLTLSGSQPSLFAYLFLPVLKRRVADLGIGEDEDERREAVLDELLGFVVHGKQTAWVVAHKSWNLEIVMNYASSVRRYLENEDLDENALKEAQAKIRARELAKQIEDEYQYVRACSAILADDSELLSSMLGEGLVDIHRRSLCFGNTALNFAIEQSSLAILRLILGHRPSSISVQYYQYGLFNLAAQRSEYAQEAVDLLVQACMSSNSVQQRRDMLSPYLSKACRTGNLPIAEGLLAWIDQNWQPTAELRWHTVKTFPLELRALAHEEVATRWFDDPREKMLCFENAFLNALLGGNISVISRLICYVDLRSWDYAGTALDYAARSPNPSTDLLRLLMDHGAPVSQNPHQCGKLSMIYFAARTGLAEWVELLLQAGADPRHRKEEQALLRFAMHGGVYIEVKRLLEKYGWVEENLEYEPRVIESQDVVQAQTATDSKSE